MLGMDGGGGSCAGDGGGLDLILGLRPPVIRDDVFGEGVRIIEERWEENRIFKPLHEMVVVVVLLRLEECECGGEGS